MQLNGAPILSATGDKDLARLRNEQIGFVFQTFHLIPDLSVLDNVEIPLLYRRLLGRRAPEAGPGRPRAGGTRLPRAPLSRRSSRAASSSASRSRGRSSGGPRLLLADEPTGNLDSQMGDEIMEILEDLNRDEQGHVVMVTHDQRLGEKTERIVRLFDGRQVS